MNSLASCKQCLHPWLLLLLLLLSRFLLASLLSCPWLGGSLKGPYSLGQLDAEQAARWQVEASSSREEAPESQACQMGDWAMPLVGARQKGDSKWEKPVSAKICGFLRFPAKICGFLRKSATPKSLDLQSEPKISENLQKSAKMCVPGPVSPFCCLPFGAP